MKTKRIFAAIAAVLVMSVTTSAFAVNNFVTNDTKNTKGQTIERVICEADGDFLTPFRKMSFTYNEAGQVTERLTLAWNSIANRWENHEKTVYDYAQTPLKVTLWVWNADNNKYEKKQK